jgi:lysophospholipase L1-like esterase
MRRLLLGLALVLAASIRSNTQPSAAYNGPICFPDRRPYPVSARPIIAFEDSITQGYGSTRDCVPDSTSTDPRRHVPARTDTSYPGDLSRLLHQVVLDYGVGGEQTSAGLERLRRTLAAVKPSRVYLLEGTNDLRAGRKVSAILADLTQMLQAVTHARASPVLLTVLPTALKSPTNAQVRALNEGILALGARRYVATVSL